MNSTSESGFRVSSIQTKLRERSVCTNAVPSLHFSFLLEQCALVLREDISYRNLLAKRRFITARPFKGERERERNKKEERVGDGDPALEDSRPVSNPMRSVCVCVRFRVQVCVLCGSFVCGVCVADLMCSMACVCVMYDMFDLCLFVCSC